MARHLKAKRLMRIGQSSMIDPLMSGRVGQSAGDRDRDRGQESTGTVAHLRAGLCLQEAGKHCYCLVGWPTTPPVFNEQLAVSA